MTTERLGPRQAAPRSGGQRLGSWASEVDMPGAPSSRVNNHHRHCSPKDDGLSKQEAWLSSHAFVFNVEQADRSDHSRTSGRLAGGSDTNKLSPGRQALHRVHSTKNVERISHVCSGTRREPPFQDLHPPQNNYFPCFH